MQACEGTSGRHKTIQAHFCAQLLSMKTGSTSRKNRAESRVGSHLAKDLVQQLAAWRINEVIWSENGQQPASATRSTWTLNLGEKLCGSAGAAECWLAVPGGRLAAPLAAPGPRSPGAWPWLAQFSRAQKSCLSAVNSCQSRLFLDLYIHICAHEYQLMI